MSNAIVTGGSGGIGSAVCRSLAEKGFDVAVCYNKDIGSAQTLAAELSENCGTRCEAFKLDLSDEESITQFYNSFAEKYGTPDVLVNNAGLESVGLFQDLKLGEISKIMQVDLVGTMQLTNLFLNGMVGNHSGKIVNITSVWGEVGASCEAAYSAAKAGIIGFTKALAKELAPSGISVNAVSPGFIDTRMNDNLSALEKSELIDDIPCCRAGTADDVAAAVGFLISDEARYVCGQVLRVDGGWI